MIDWRIARGLATTVAGDGEHRAPVSGTELGEIVARCTPAVTTCSRLGLTAPLPQAELVERDVWIEANIDLMRGLLDPLGDRIDGEGTLGGLARSFTSLATGVQVGALLGLMSQRVMGQFALSLIDHGDEPRLLFVGPNLGKAAHELETKPHDLVTWVALHEVTHAVQFGGAPWLRDHLGGLIGELVSSLEVRLAPGAMRLPSGVDLRRLADAALSGDLLSVVASEEQRALIDRLQTTMSVVEGHAEYVMDAAADGLLDDVAGMRERLDRRRRERNPLEQLIARLLGFEMKLRQYQQGGDFCRAVARLGGEEALARVWEGPDALPDKAELRAPEVWLARVLP